MIKAALATEHPTTIKAERESDIEQIHKGIILGIRDYFHKSGFKQAILGLSGGIDSAVVCALAAEALGPKMLWRCCCHPVSQAITL